MVNIAGQTAGPNGLTFFLGNPGSNIAAKIVSTFFLKSKFFLNQNIFFQLQNKFIWATLGNPASLTYLI